MSRGPMSDSQRYADPGCLLGRGGPPVLRSLFRPPMRGDGAPKGAVSGFRRTARRISPGGPLPGLTHHTNASASPDAPLAVSVRFRVSRCPAMWGLTPASLLQGPLGGGVTNSAREYRIPLPSCGVPRRTPLAWNETIYHMGEIHPDVKIGLRRFLAGRHVGP